MVQLTSFGDLGAIAPVTAEQRANIKANVAAHAHDAADYTDLVEHLLGREASRG